MLALHCILLEKQRHCKQRSCWQKTWICRWRTLGFSIGLVHELAAEDISEFQVMFHMSTDK